jgi:GMP synthase (glutamine-hydrolysing)
MKAVIIQHVAFESLGNIEKHLFEHGFDIEIMNAAQDKIIGILESQPDLLVILGGPISVNDVVDYPFIEDELIVLQQRLTLGLPVLGICLGAQLIAKALGANVYPSDGKEIGWGGLALENTEFFPAMEHLSQENTNVLHWHGETFDLPEGAVRLASSPKCMNQAFLFGGNTLALQFHPEATERDMESWFVGHTAEIASVEGISVSQLRYDTKNNASALFKAAQLFWPEWLDSITKIDSSTIINS